MLFRKYGQAVLVAHERRSRLIRLRRQPSKAAQFVLNSLGRLLRRLPTALRRSITFDNGSEFALHRRLAHRYRMRTFFCEPHAPWQKGGIENAIGRLRRPLPRKSDLAVGRAELSTVGRTAGALVDASGSCGTVLAGPGVWLGHSTSLISQRKDVDARARPRQARA